MLRLVVALCLLLLTVAPTVAGHSLRHAVATTVVEMHGQSEESGGRCSAVMVAPGRAFTAAHCVAMVPNPKVRINGVDYDVSEAYAVENASDVAVLIAPGAPCPCAIIARVPAKVGDKVMSTGYPMRAALVVTYGEVQALEVTNPEDGNAYVMSTAPTVPGFSGGGVFNDQGHLLGINSSTGARGLLSLYGPVLSVFIGR